MLLRVGAIMMLVSVTLAAGVAVAVVAFRGEESYTEPAAVSSVEQPRATETAKEEDKKPNLGKQLEIKDEESGKEPRREGPQPRSEPRAESPSEPTRESLMTDPAPLLAATEWPRPTNEEIAAAAQPRYFAPDPGAPMTLTVEALGLYDVPVFSSDGLEALDTSLLHVPETSFPWDGGAQRNVYISGHYLGYPGTASRLVFYNLDKLKKGDEVLLKDRGGRAYRYRVSEAFTAASDESWVMGQEVGRDMVTLQTCIPPTFEERLILRADRV